MNERFQQEPVISVDRRFIVGVWPEKHADNESSIYRYYRFLLETFILVGV